MLSVDTSSVGRNMKQERPWEIARTSLRSGQASGGRTPPRGPMKPKLWPPTVNFWVALSALATAATAAVALKNDWFGTAGSPAPIVQSETLKEGEVQKPVHILPQPTPNCEAQYANSATGMLIDISDPIIDPDQRVRLLNASEEVAQNTGPGQAIVVAGLNDTYLAPLDVQLRDCNPGSAADFSPLTHNLSQVRADQAEFLKRSNATLEGLFDPGTKKASPVCEGIKNLALQPEMLYASPGERKIVVVSDMMQFGGIEGKAFYSDPMKFLSNFPERCQVDLTGYHVAILLYDRAKPQQRDEVLGRWSDIYTAMGAEVEIIRR